ncbi:MAG TPA: zinc metallopeptidase [Gemmataceae bacterium]|nr:zinc metallopeptidase [Gemmataceae bacterium]
MLFFDPMYFLFLAPGILLAMWAQFRVHSAYSQASRILAQSGVSGAQAAAALLDSAGVSVNTTLEDSPGVRGVRIQAVQGFMTDHYVPGQRILRLSPDVYNGRSLAALGIAAHEAGHALQDAQRYPLLVLRNGLVPLASIGSNLSWIIIIAGFLLHMVGLVYLGIFAFALVVLFQVVNLPVEFDASRRARLALVHTGLISDEEERTVANVLNAAALTYVAATLTSILTLLYFLFRSGILGGRSR